MRLFRARQANELALSLGAIAAGHFDGVTCDAAIDADIIAGRVGEALALFQRANKRRRGLELGAGIAIRCKVSCDDLIASDLLFFEGFGKGLTTTVARQVIEVFGVEGLNVTIFKGVGARDTNDLQGQTLNACSAIFLRPLSLFSISVLARIVNFPSPVL